MGYLARFRRQHQASQPEQHSASPTLPEMLVTPRGLADVQGILSPQRASTPLSTQSIPSEILSRKDLTNADKLVLGYLASRTPLGDACDSTLQQIGNAIGSHKSTALRSVRRLEASGWLTISVRPLPHPRVGTRFYYRLREATLQTFYRAWGVMSSEIRALGEVVAQGLRLTYLLNLLRRDTERVRRPEEATEGQLDLYLSGVSYHVEDPEGLRKGLAFLPEGLRGRLGGFQWALSSR